MAWLKAYEWERETYPAFREVQVARQDAQKYFNRLARHFKVSTPLVNLHSKKRNGGNLVYWWGQVNIPSTTTLGTIVHEFSHHLSYQTYVRKGRGHGKRFKSCLKKSYTFAKRWIKETTPLQA